MIVEQGKVVEICAEPGEFVFDASTEPSIFSGDLDTSITETFLNIGKRFTFGGEAPKEQRVYYFNTKELPGNKYGTPSPVPFRVVDSNVGLDIDISIRCFGEYSYRVCDPMLLYTNICGNLEEAYLRETIDGQLKSELMTALQPAFAKISAMGIRYSALPGHTMELAGALNDVLSEKWRKLRGIEVVSFGVTSVKASDEDERMIKELQRNAAFRNPTMAAAHLVGAQAEAMQNAAANESAGGAVMGFMGMNMAGQAGRMNTANLFAMGQRQAPQAPAAAATGWTCSCGAVNKGIFCSECGKPKPAGVPQYKCDKCGWEPEKSAKSPKFCPECGDVFDGGDIIGNTGLVAREDYPRCSPMQPGVM
jgi:membrane protease subunit (stomatin/prohibitin family)